MTDMMDYFNDELENMKSQEVEQQLVNAQATVDLYMEEIRKMNVIIAMLKYFLATGEVLDPEALGLDLS
jgi:hypothetical protein